MGGERLTLEKDAGEHHACWKCVSNIGVILLNSSNIHFIPLFTNDWTSIQIEMTQEVTIEIHVVPLIKLH